MNRRGSDVWMRVVLAMGLGVGACGSPESSPDAGGMTDAGETDAAIEPVDAGSDGGHWTAPTDCEGTGVDIYTPPPGVPDFTTSDRGRVIACGQGDALTAEAIDASARANLYDGPPLTSGVTATRILYQIERRSGEGSYASGVLYLPSAGATDAPLIVYAAGTTGLADTCAPSAGMHFTDFERGFFVLIGSGHAVFVPDLAGLGTPGTMAWLEPVDAGRSVLDGARAALEVAPEGALSGELLLAGHSAGGHAALAAQSFQREYAPELNVLGVAGVAAAYINTSDFGVLLGMPGYDTTNPMSGWNVVYAAMYFVGHTAAYDGEDQAWNPIEASIRDRVRTIYGERCLQEVDGVDLRSALAEVAPNAGALFDPALRSSVSRCALGDCDEVGTAWQARFAADRPTLDPEGAPVWFHHGEDDQRILLSSMICPIRRAMAADPRVQACVYAGADHNTIPARTSPWIVEWATALASGAAAPACPDPTELPPGSCGL
ncbi:MAG: lipase family protein [Myxococcota bacterium]|nr:lipase family protein [Myxococcota bacterium]